MSVYIHFDHEKTGNQVASTSGWGDFTSWVDGLDEKEYPYLFEFVENGHTPNVTDFFDELSEAKSVDPPEDPDVKSIVDGLLDQFGQHKNADYVGITHGMGE